MLHPWRALKSLYLNKGTMRAESLAFKTLWSIVPLIVLVTAVMGSVGYLDLLIKLVPQIWSWLQLNLDMTKIIVILKRAQSFDFTSLGLIGAGALLLTFYNLMDAIDDNINQAWNISKSRSIGKRLLVYFPFLILLVLFLILLSQALTVGQHILDSLVTRSRLPKNLDAPLETMFLIGFMLGILTIFNFFLLWILPRTRVRFWPVFSASIATSFIVIIFLGGVSFFQGLLFKNYQAFWGSMALLPVFLLLLYGFWLIILWGAALCRQLHSSSKAHQRVSQRKKKG